MKRLTFLMALVILLPGLRAAAKGVDLKYDVIAGGNKVGSLTLKETKELIDGVKVRHADAFFDLQIKVGLVPVLMLNIVDSATIDDEGLVEMERRAEINKEKSRFTVKRQGDKLAIRLESAEGGADFPIYSKDYDLTSEEGSSQLLKKPGASVTYRRLSFDDFKVADETVTWVANETLELSGKKHNCRVITFENPQEQGKRWLVVGEYTVLVKEVGRDKNGPYEVILREWR